MEVVLLPYTKQYKLEVPYFIKEVTRLAKEYNGAIVKSSDQIGGKSLKKASKDADVFIIPFVKQNILTAYDLDPSKAVHNIVMTLNTIAADIELGFCTRFCEYYDSSTGRFWREVKSQLDKNKFKIMRHYS